MDKAGAYGIQGRAGAFVSEIRGSYSGVMGLPLHETALLLARFGIGRAITRSPIVRRSRPRRVCGAAIHAGAAAHDFDAILAPFFRRMPA